MGCGLSAVWRWLVGALQAWPRGLAWALQGGLAVVTLAMPLYPLWQNWPEVDQSDSVYFQEMAEQFVAEAGPEFVLVDSEPHYDDLEAILYVAWGERGWYAARWITPEEVEAWLGRRPVYAWDASLPEDDGYRKEPVPALPGMVRVLGVAD